MILASNLENEDEPSNTQRCPPPEVPLTEPHSSDVALSSSIPAPTPAQRTKTSNIPEQDPHQGHGSMSRKPDDPMAQVRKIPQLTSPVPQDQLNRAQTPPNSNNTDSSQPISQLSRLSFDHDPAGSMIDYGNSQALLRGVMVDLKARECPFFDLLRVREILERTHMYRYSSSTT